MARLARAIAPELPIHASTQMTCTDASSVELARELGATRVILARELSLDDIAKVRARHRRRGRGLRPRRALHLVLGAVPHERGDRRAEREPRRVRAGVPAARTSSSSTASSPDTGDRAYLLSPEDLESVRARARARARSACRRSRSRAASRAPSTSRATTRLYRKAIDAAIGDGRRAHRGGAARGAPDLHARLGPGLLPGRRSPAPRRGARLRSSRARGRRASRASSRSAAHVRSWSSSRSISRAATASSSRAASRARARSAAASGPSRSAATTSSARTPATTAHVWLGPDVRARRTSSARRRARTRGACSARARPRWRSRSCASSSRRRARTRLDLADRGARSASRSSSRAARPRAASRASPATRTIEEARSAPLDETALREKLGKLGDSPFELGVARRRAPGGDHRARVVAQSRAAGARRGARRDGGACTHPTTGASYTDLLDARRCRRSAPRPTGGLFVLCRNVEQATAALDAGADGVYLDFLELTGHGRGAALAPRARRASSASRRRGSASRARRRSIATSTSLAPDAILVRGLGALRELSRGDGPAAGAIGDFSLNVTNRLTAAEVLGRGLAAFTPSFDLDAAQLVDLVGASASGVAFGPGPRSIVHHPMALFHMEHCVIAALLSEGRDHRTCGRPCDRHQVSLRDRAGMDHPVEADVGCRNTVFHARPQSAVQLLPAARGGRGRGASASSSCARRRRTSRASSPLTAARSRRPRARTTSGPSSVPTAATAW